MNLLPSLFVAAEEFLLCEMIDHFGFSAVWNQNVFCLELNEFSLTGVLGALFDAREGEQLHGIGALLCGSSLHLNNAVQRVISLEFWLKLFWFVGIIVFGRWLAFGVLLLN